MQLERGVERGADKRGRGVERFEIDELPAEPRASSVYLTHRILAQ